MKVVVDFPTLTAVLVMFGHHFHVHVTKNL